MKSDVELEEGGGLLNNETTTPPARPVWWQRFMNPSMPQINVHVPGSGEGGSCCRGRALCWLVLGIVVLSIVALAVILTWTSRWDLAERVGSLVTAELARAASLQTRHTIMSILDTSGTEVTHDDAVVEQTKTLAVATGWVDTHARRLDWLVELQDGHAWFSAANPRSFFIWAQVYNESTRLLQHLTESPFALGSESGSLKEHLPGFLGESARHVFYTLAIHSSQRDWIIALF